MRSTSKRKYTVIDLFAGAGGLSHGFLQTGRFEIKAAFENNLDAQKTYKRNHAGTEIYDDVADALTAKTKKELGQIDVVIGGPPCQGFSNANRQKNHVISQNNSLVKKFVQTVLHLNPTAFVMENVSMLRSEVHRFYEDENDAETIEKYNITKIPADISLLDEAFMFGGADDIASDANLTNMHLWSENDYLVLNVIYKARKNTKKLTATLKKYKNKLLILAGVLLTKRKNGHISKQEHKAGEAIQLYFGTKHTDKAAMTLCDAIESTIMIQRMLSKAKEIHDNRIVVKEYSKKCGLVARVYSMAVVDYIESVLGASKNGYRMKKEVLSAANFGTPQKRMRFVIVGIKKGKADTIELPKGTLPEKKFRTVGEAIKDLEDVDPTPDIAKGDKGWRLSAAPKGTSVLGRQLRNSKTLYNHVSTATTEEALVRFRAIKQGENFHDLPQNLKSTYSDAARTQNTIYMRLRYDEPSGTVVNVRKSMWIHPVKHRALSIREAARLQTFPDSFVFCGTKDSQYQQVGNAVPPVLAKAIAEHLCNYLDGGKNTNSH